MEKSEQGASAKQWFLSVSQLSEPQMSFNQVKVFISSEKPQMEVIMKTYERYTKSDNQKVWGFLFEFEYEK